MTVLSEILETEKILNAWKGKSYVFGQGVLDKVGEFARPFGMKTLLVGSSSSWAQKPLKTITESLEKNGISWNMIVGARPNCPREDVYRIAMQTAVYKPSSIVAVGGGSTIDACKAASVLATYMSSETSRVLSMGWSEACTIDPYFGTDIVTKLKEATHKDVIPVVAVQTAASSASHLTKYSNITDPIVSQKKLIVDNAIVPKAAIFDYGLTVNTSESLTVDGGMDGIAHLWEVFMGATDKPYYEKVKQITVIGLNLIVKNLKLAKDKPDNVGARTALGLGTDLGGYAIMIGGTSGAHLSSFSLVDILTHGRACGLLNPYYTVFFAPRIQNQLRDVAPIFKETGFIREDIEKLEGRELGEAVAKGMIGFGKSLGVPTTLKEAGATEEHVNRILTAAKDPQLKMKLLNMPIPLDLDKGDVERYMKWILKATFTGDMGLIRIMKP